MASRSSASATISLGLLSIPVKFYLAAASDTFSFNQITTQNNKVKQKLVDEITGEEVERESLRKGYEYEKGTYAIFSDEEIEALLEEEKRNKIDLVEFVKDDYFDAKSVEKVYYLHPDKGAEKSYLLLSKTLSKLDKMAVGKYYGRGKDNLVVIRATGDRLTLFQMYYASEVRAFEYQFSAACEPSEQELSLATKLVKQLSSNKFDPKNYSDDFSARVRQAVEAKRASQNVVSINAKGNSIPRDLVSLMKDSLAEKKEEKKVAKAR